MLLHYPVAYILVYFYTIKTTTLLIHVSFFTACAYLSSKIYCFGGAPDGTSKSADSNIYSLSLEYSSPVSVSSMNVNWEKVPLNNFDPEKRYSPQFAALSDSRRLFINSGDATYLINNTIVFDSYDNAWQKLPDFSDDKQRYA